MGVRPPDIPPGPANAGLRDAASMFEPWRQYVGDVIGHDLPLWNPYEMTGRPLLANAQSAVFSPFSLPAYVLPFLTSLAVTAILKLFAASFGMFLLARAIGMRMGGALLAGTAFGFSFNLIVWLAWPVASVWALFPWALLLTALLAERPTALLAAGLAAVVGLQFLGGHPETSFFALFGVVAFLVLRLATGPGERTARARLRVLGLFAGAGLVGAALAGVVLVPFLEFLGRSADTSIRTGGEGFHLDVKYMKTALIPDFWGSFTHFAYVTFPFDIATYAGALTLMLALGALVLRPSGERFGLAGFCVFCGAVVYGLQPLFDLLTSLPGFDSTKPRLLPLCIAPVALLAGRGLDDLATVRVSPRRAAIVVAAGAVLLLLPLLWVDVFATSIWRPALKSAWAFATPPGHPFPTQDIIRLAGVFVWLPIAAASLALIALRATGRLSSPWFVGLVLLLLVADLVRAGMGYNSAVQRRAATQPATPAIRYLQSRRPARFAGIGEALRPNLAIRYRLYDARGYDFPTDRRFHEFWDGNVQTSPLLGYGPREIPELDATLAPSLGGLGDRWVRGVSLLGVADIIEGPNDRPLKNPRLKVVYDGPDARVYRNSSALPRAFLVGAQQHAPSRRAALRQVYAPTFDGRRVAVTERSISGLPSAPPPGLAGSATIQDYRPEKVRVRTRAPRRSLLVLSDLHYPGWVARVDGRREPIHRVDYLLRGVMVPAGAHEVTFRYEPRSWRTGLAFSVAALIAIAVGVGTALISRRARARRT